MSTCVNRSTDQQVNKSTQDNTNLWQCSCMQLHARADFKRKKVESASIFQSLRRHKPVNTEQTKLQKVYPLLALWCVCVCVCVLGTLLGGKLCPTGRQPWALQKIDGASSFFVWQVTWHAELKILRCLEREMHTPTPSADKSDW